MNLHFTTVIYTTNELQYNQSVNFNEMFSLFRIKI